MHYFKYSQQLPWTIETCWAFFSNPNNLKRLTPEHMDFKILNEVGEKMYAGQIIIYTLRPVLNVPITWVNEITHVEPFSYFVDQQRFGPYTFWHHEHRFIPNDKGVLMQDTIYYKLPLGPIGKLLNAVKVKGDIESLFAFRDKALLKIFTGDGQYK